MTDESVMELVKNGDLDKAGVLYERYKTPIFNFFLRFGIDRDNSLDLTQQSFFRMIKYKASFNDKQNFKTWIYKIARNQFHDFLSKNKSRQVLHLKVETEEYCEDKEHQEAQVLTALEKLPDSYKEVLKLSRFENLKYHEIAKILDVSEEVVKIRAFRGIKKLKEIYLKLENEA